MSHAKHKTNTSQYWCPICTNYFENLMWDGDQTRCPNCGSTKSLDIKEEVAAVAAHYHKGKRISTDYDPYP